MMHSMLVSRSAVLKCSLRGAINSHLAVDRLEISAKRRVRSSGWAARRCGSGEGQWLAGKRGLWPGRA